MKLVIAFVAMVFTMASGLIEIYRHWRLLEPPTWLTSTASRFMLWLSDDPERMIWTVAVVSSAACIVMALSLESEDLNGPTRARRS